MISKIADGLQAVVDAVCVPAAFLTVVLVTLVASNVLLRYLFSAGAVWAQELEWHLLLPIAVFGAVYAQRMGDHVRIDMLYERLPEAGRRAIDLVAAVVMLFIALWLIRLAIPWVGQSWRIGEFSPDPGGLPARWALKGLIPVGLGFLALQAVVDGLREIAWFAGERTPAKAT